MRSEQRPASARLLVDRIEAARLLGVCGNTVSNLIARGELPSLKIGARRLIDVHDINRFIDSRKEVSK
jgi:putative molybdopterin biosynthesis protein